MSLPSYNGLGKVVIFGHYMHDQGFSFCLYILTIFPAFIMSRSLSAYSIFNSFSSDWIWKLQGMFFLQMERKYWLPIACECEFRNIFKCSSYLLSLVISLIHLWLKKITWMKGWSSMYHLASVFILNFSWIFVASSCLSASEWKLWPHMITVTFVRDVNVTVCVSDLLHVTAHDAVASNGSLPALLRATLFPVAGGTSDALGRGCVGVSILHHVEGTTLGSLHLFWQLWILFWKSLMQSVRYWPVSNLHCSFIFLSPSPVILLICSTFWS